LSKLAKHGVLNATGQPNSTAAVETSVFFSTTQRTN